jgi:hypothetical protein
MHPAVRRMADIKAKEQGYKSRSAYIAGLVVYDMYCGQPHKLTVELMNGPVDMQEKVFAEVLAHPGKPTSWFKHRLEEVAKAATILLACFFLIGCVTGEKMSRLHPGMTKAQVVSTLGRPDGFRTENGAEVLSWNNRLSSGWAHDRADYNVILVNGKVTEYGQGTVRPKENGTLVIIPLKPR